MEIKKVTVIVYPDEDGGFTAIMPYFNCSLISQGTCLTAQGWTAEEALSEARVLLEGYLVESGAKGRRHVESACLESVEVREMEVGIN